VVDSLVPMRPLKLRKAWELRHSSTHLKTAQRSGIGRLTTSFLPRVGSGLDADERVPKLLAEEIVRTITNGRRDFQVTP